MSMIYITEPNSKTYFHSQQIINETQDGLVTKLPIEMLEAVVLVGNTNMTTGCQRELLLRNIAVSFIEKSGQIIGRLESHQPYHIHRQRQQFALGEQSMFCLAFARKIIMAKVHNQQVVLRRYNRDKQNRKTTQLIEEMKKLEYKMTAAVDIPQLMGLEGLAARYYFQGLALLVNPRFSFHSRSKRPPKDPFNAMLSFGYSLLHHEMYQALVNKGLHPYAGFMHQDRHNHASLVSDLIEEWRAVIIDSLVMSLLSQDKFTLDDFDYQQQGVYLDKCATKKFIKSFHQKLMVQASYLSYTDQKMSFRRAIQEQVAMLAKVVDQQELDHYQPVRIR